jgi:hypothetical protein
MLNQQLITLMIASRINLTPRNLTNNKKRAPLIDLSNI